MLWAALQLQHSTRPHKGRCLLPGEWEEAPGCIWIGRDSTHLQDTSPQELYQLQEAMMPGSTDGFNTDLGPEQVKSAFPHAGSLR